MKLAASQQLFAYWNELRGARSAPERNDIDPGAIRGILADTFILEFDAGRAFPMRIVGTRTNALFLRELRGAPFLDLWREGDRQETRAILASVADEAQPFLIGAAGTPLGFAPVDIEMLLLPLRHHGDTHSRILGCCAPKRRAALARPGRRRIPGAADAPRARSGASAVSTSNRRGPAGPRDFGARAAHSIVTDIFFFTPQTADAVQAPAICPGVIVR